MNSGVYNYFLNGEPTGVIETFSIEKLSDNTIKTISKRDATPFNTIITVETIKKENKFPNFKIDYKKADLLIEAVYNLAEKTFHILRKINGKIVQDKTFDLPENAIFFPLMRCFQGQTILQVAEKQDFVTVVVPDIQPTTKFEDLLKPTFDERTAKLTQQKDNLFIYNYLSKHYDDYSEFHLDENGLLVYYKFVQNESQTWEVILTP